MRLSLSRSAVLFHLFLLAGGPLAGCQQSADKSKGTLPRGPEKTETRAIGPFQGVVAEGRVEIIVKPGGTKDAQLKGPSNYLEHLTLRTETRELGGQQIPVLVATLDKGVQLPLPQVEVQTDSLKYIRASGPARVLAGDFSGMRLEVVATEAARVEMEPASYGVLSVETTMAARVVAPQVSADRAELTAQGPSRIQVGNVAELKRVRLEGGKVVTKGEPQLVN